MKDPIAIAAINEKARDEGWKAVEVVDSGSKHAYMMVFGTTMSDRAAREHLMERAKARSAFHLKVLQQLMASRVPAQKKKAR